MKARRPEQSGPDAAATGVPKMHSNASDGFPAAALIVACCAGPALFAAGTLVAIGVVTRSPWALAAAGLLAYFAYALTARRWPRGGRKQSVGACGLANHPACRMHGRTAPAQRRTDR